MKTPLPLLMAATIVAAFCSAELGRAQLPKDTDQDGVNDYREGKDGTDPKNAGSFNPLSKGLVGYFPLRGNLSDESGNGLQSENVNCSFGKNRRGEQNAALRFDGSQYARVKGLGGVLGGSSEITISAWYLIESGKSHPLGYGSGFIEDTAQGEAKSPALGVGVSGDPNNAIGAWMGAWKDAFTSTKFPMGSWAQITTVLRVGSSPQIYLNGKPLEWMSPWIPPVLAQPVKFASDYGIGAHLSDGQPYWGSYSKGGLSDLRFYNRALSATEVGQLYKAESQNTDTEPKERLFGIDVDRGKVVEIDQTTGDLIDFASLPFETNYGVGFDYRSTDGKLYASRFVENKVSFYSIDLSSGAVELTDKVMTVPAGSPPPFSIGFTASGNVYGYGERTAFDTGDFWFGDWDSGTFTLIPNGERSPSVLGGDFDDAKQVYWISDEWDGQVYQLNPSTGQRVWASSVIWDSKNSGDLYDMDLTPSGEVLVVGYSAAGGKILSVDPATGTAVEKFSLPAGSAVTRIASVPLVLPPAMKVEEPVGKTVANNAKAKAFGNVLAGAGSSNRVYTIRNTGAGPLTSIVVGKLGSHTNDFTVTPPATNALAPGATTSFSVSFNPTTGGPRAAQVSIGSNDTNNNPFVINLSGFGIGFNRDSDKDGLSDAAEYLLKNYASSFDWESAQPALVGMLFSNANPAGFFTKMQYDANFGAGRTAGRSDVTNKPAAYNLVSRTNIPPVRVAMPKSVGFSLNLGGSWTRYAQSGAPAGWSFDTNTGVLSGVVPSSGERSVRLIPYSGPQAGPQMTIQVRPAR